MKLQVGYQLSTEYRASHPGPIYKYIARYLRRTWRTAVAASVRAMHERVSIHSGMSRASLYPLASKVRIRSHLRAEDSLLSKGPQPGHKLWSPGVRGGLPARWSHNVGPYKSRAFGERLGKGAYVYNPGSVEDPKMEYSYRINVYQWAIYESKWGALSAAHAAFMEAYRGALVGFAPAKILSEYIWQGKYPVNLNEPVETPFDVL